MKEVATTAPAAPTTSAPLEHVVTSPTPAPEVLHETKTTETHTEQVPAKEVKVEETTVKKD